MQVRARSIHPDLRLTAHAVAGRYRLDRLLGRGGAADVYEAQDLRLRRAVAVKMFRPSGPHGAEAQCASGPHGPEAQCAEEGRLLARMQHPGLVTLYDTGSDEGRPYLVMQLVEGTTLRRRVARAVLTPVETCRVGAALASALAHVHARDVVHRDVKPSNILLDTTDVPHLADFGISRRLDVPPEPEPEPDHTFLGTASYMAPEQALGRHAGPRADVYSLGLVLLETLKGEAEYGGAPLEAALAHLHRAPVLPSGLPPRLARLLTAMTARSPASRPDAAACAKALADPRTAGRSPEPPATPSASRAPGRPATGSADRSSARPGRRPTGVRAVAATLATIGLSLTGSLSSSPAGDAPEASPQTSPSPASPAPPSHS
ncbi:serine/threonine-protein kinase [Streptomyces sp. NPDC048330]|uniref:serine/threonine-protein kinase n=1 Tax=Streptomyces sp. NPDC048330 TaxID=3365533 RepID=UPI00371230C2